MKRRILTLCLVLALILSLALPAFALTSQMKYVNQEGFCAYGGTQLYIETSTGASTGLGVADMHCDDTTYRIQSRIRIYVTKHDGSTTTFINRTTLKYTMDATTSVSSTYTQSGVIYTGTVTSAVGSYYVESSLVRETTVS